MNLESFFTGTFLFGSDGQSRIDITGVGKFISSQMLVQEAGS